MRRWVVTGPAGAGKSALCGFLADRGAAVVQGDALGHEILAREEVLLAVDSSFGPEVIVDGCVDRRALGKIVFGNPAAMNQLNAITHGPLAELAAQRLDALDRGGRHRLAVFEAAIYFLLPPVPAVDLVITVTATESTRKERLVARGGLSEMEADTRIEAQRNLADRWSRADLVLTNDGPLETLAAEAGRLWERLED